MRDGPFSVVYDSRGVAERYPATICWPENYYRGEPMLGNHQDVQQPKAGVIGLALWCSLGGFVFGYLVLGTVSIRAAILCAGLIGLIVGHCLGRDYDLPQEGYR
jgi:hypothetical protein